MTRLILGCVLCLGLWLASAPVRAQQAAPFRTDESTDDKLPWFQLVAGEFPPAGSAHYFSGELIRVDAIERTFVLRVDRTDKQNRSHFDLPIAATMLPFGAVAYHGAPAALRDVPIGTHLHGWFYEKDPNDDTKPLEIFHNRRSYEVDFNRCFRLEDDFSYYTAKQQFWRIDGVDRETQKLTATLVADDKPIGEPQEFDLQTTTRVWRGSGFARQEELAAGQMVQFNLTWATLYGPGRLVEIWLDEASRQQATAQEIDAVGQDGDGETRQVADEVAGDDGLQEGLAEVGPQRRNRGDEARPDRARRRQQHGRHGKAAHETLPQDQQCSAKQ